MKVQFYCFLNSAKIRLKQIAKRMLRGEKMPVNKLFVDFLDDDFDEAGNLKLDLLQEDCYINEQDVKQGIQKDMVFPIENLVSNRAIGKTFVKSHLKRVKASGSSCHNFKDAALLWQHFMESSRIPKGFKHEGLSYAGFINEYQEWCLPSWIWTNGALARCYCTLGLTEKATVIGDLLLKYQTDSGGWIVRYDYGSDAIKPLLAPNDSAYIANNGCLSIYQLTGKQEFLDAAVRCGDWIIETARSDGMVYFGFDTLVNKWDSDHNIVDVGFTAGLFVNLFKITNNIKYQDFALKFASSYIKLFYDKDKGRFWSSIGRGDIPRGTGFARGQAWALEGLISVYELSQDDRIGEIIRTTIRTLLAMQNSDGSWPRELDKPALGSDCKGTPVIAYSLLKWAKFNETDSNLIQRILSAVKIAFDWCVKHTATDGIGMGGIYSYCFEGAIVHHPNTSTAFVYGSSYALEIAKMMGKEW